MRKDFSDSSGCLGAKERWLVEQICSNNKKKCCKKNGTTKDQMKKGSEEWMDDEAEALFSVFADEEIQRNSDLVVASKDE